MAGIGILGTQAASEFVCREPSAAQLLAALGVKEVRGAGGAPVHTRLLIVRVLKSEN
jgi:hypothetical protein